MGFPSCLLLHSSQCLLAIGREDRCASAEEHLLQEVVDLRDAARLGDADLLDHLPRDRLQARQRQQDLAEAAAAVVQTLGGDVVLQVDLCSVVQQSFTPEKEFILSDLFLFSVGYLCSPFFNCCPFPLLI